MRPGCTVSLLVLFLHWSGVMTLPAHGREAGGNYEQTLAISQAALGNRVRDQAFTDSRGVAGRLSEFQNKPLVLSMVYSSCNHVCPRTTRNLASAVMKAREALGDGSFNVLSVGFDTRFDSPDRMAYFAAQQSVGDSHWRLVSMDDAAVRELAEDIGFAYRANAGGFDHLVQTTVLDPGGRVYRQVYGQSFNTPLLVDPLIALVLGRSDPGRGLLADLKDKVRLFCTSYDPVRDGYYFDYSLFLGVLIGAVIIGLTGYALVREARGG